MKKLRCLLAATLLMTCSVSLVSYGGPGSRTAYLKRNWGETTAAESRPAAGGSTGSSTGSTAGGSRTAAKADRKILNDAVHKTQDQNSMEVQTSLDLDMSLGAEQINMFTVINIKAQDIGKSSMKYIMSTHAEILGQKSDTDAFYTDGYYYADSDGQKSKTAVDRSRIMELLATNTNSDWMDSSDLFKDMKVAEDKKGNKVFTFTCDMEHAGSVVSDFYDELGLDDGTAVNLLNGTVYVNSDGYMTRQALDMDMNVEVDDQTINVSMKMDITYANPGKAVTVNLPSTAGY